MKIHFGDDSTPYRQTVQLTLLFKLPLFSSLTKENYIDSMYPNLRHAVSQNKRPADLCGLSELTDHWYIGMFDFHKYIITLNIIGLGIEYTKDELVKFFLSVFPEFTDCLPRSALTGDLFGQTLLLFELQI